MLSCVLLTKSTLISSWRGHRGVIPMTNGPCTNPRASRGLQTGDVPALGDVVDHTLLLCRTYSLQAEIFHIAGEK